MYRGDIVRAGESLDKPWIGQSTTSWTDVRPFASGEKSNTDRLVLQIRHGLYDATTVPFKGVVDKVLDAWTNEGPYPMFHRVVRNRLREMWPTLYNALVALEKASKE